MRPRNPWFITRATASGNTSSSGTLMTVKIVVACMAFQNGVNATELESNSAA